MTSSPLTLNTRRPGRRTRLQAAAVLAAGTLLLGNCGSATDATSTAAADASASTPASTPASTSTPASSAPNGASTPMQAGPVMVADQWVKAIPDPAATRMTGVFAKLRNTTEEPVTIVSGRNSVSSLTELHETVMVDGSMQMRPVSGGFTIEPGQTRELKPGGDHIMVMMMTKPLNVGDELTVTLLTDDNQTIEFKAVARAFTGANETYVSSTM